MPSKSPAQARLMRAVAHGWKKPGGGGPSQSVAKEFVNADRRKKVQGYQYGGRAMPTGMMDPRQKAQLGPLSQTTGGPGSPWRGAPPPQARRMPIQPPGGRRGFGGRRGPSAPPPRPVRQDPRRAGPQGGALAQIMQQLQGQAGGRMRGMKRPPGGRMAPPPNKYPGGGNPMMGGRNPMMRQRGRYMGASPTRMLR
jgi:hypothetical protein